MTADGDADRRDDSAARNAWTSTASTHRAGRTRGRHRSTRQARCASPTAARCPTTSSCSRPARGRAGCRFHGAEPAGTVLYLRTFDGRARHARARSCRAPASPSSAAASSASSSRRARRARRRVTLVEAAPRMLMRGVPPGIAALHRGAASRGPASSIRPASASRASRRPEAPRHRLADGGGIAADAVDRRHRRRAGDGARRRRPGSPSTTASASTDGCETSRSRHLRRRRLLLLPASALWRPAHAAGSLAQRPGPGQPRRAQHARGRRELRRRAVVLVRSVRSLPADRRPCRRGPRRPSTRDSATAPRASSSISPPTAGSSPPAASARSAQIARESAWPRC